MQHTSRSSERRLLRAGAVRLAGVAVLLGCLAFPSFLLADATPASADSDSHAAVESLSYLDQLPPLLDRQVFFGDPEITGSQISPDGKYFTFIKPYGGVQNVWIKGLDEDWDAARPLTADERPVPGYFWSEDSKFLLYVQDKGGNENFHVYAVDPSAEAEEATGVPPARNLTPIDGVRAFIYAVPEATPGQILVGLNDRDPALHDVYRLDLATGDRELLIENDSNVAGWVTDLDGNVRLAVRQTPDGGTETLKVKDGKLGDVIYSCGWQEACAPVRFHKDGKRAYLISNKGEDVDLSQLYLMDAETGETELLESDPEGEVDLGGTIFSDKTEELIATVYVGDRTRTYPKTQKLKDALAFLEKELPEGEIGFTPQTNDDRLVKVVVSSDVDSGTVYVYDWQEGTVEKLYESRPELPSEHLAPMQAIRYQARDGLTIPAYLVTPKGALAKSLALVVMPHGGPWARSTWGYNPIAQFLANRGYAVMMPNFRSSAGFGKEFLNAGNKEWGRAMQHDISDGVKHLVDQGIADPDRVCIMGGSYGGYATLAGLTFTPELYACGVDIVGPSNLITLYNSLPAYWGPIVKIFALRLGDPEIEEDRKMMVERSPLTHVDKIEDPLLVIQGANDPRVKKAEADQIVIAMREKGLPVEYIVAPDEGHGFSGRENRLAMFARVEQFLDQHLGGRHQESVAEDVAAKLADITVDVASVEAPKIATGLDLAKKTPLPQVNAADLALGTHYYTSNLSIQGQQMAVASTRVYKAADEEGESVLHLDASASTPMGDVSDSYVVDGETLQPLRRLVKQGPATVELTYGDREVTGQIQAGPQQMPVKLDLEAPVFGSDAALDAVLTCLPLAEGYRTYLRYADIGMQQKVRFFSLEVVGTEAVEVPAGTFETFKVQLEALDGEGGDKTSWVTVETPRKLVKSSGTLPPQMGGGTVESVLTHGPTEDATEDGASE